MTGINGSILLFSGSKGGCGCSFIANTVASYLAIKKNRSILLVDLNTGKNDSRIIFDLLNVDNRDIGDLTGNIGDIDISVLKRLIVNFDNSLNLILPSLKPAKYDIFKNGGLPCFFKLLREVFEIIIIDIPLYIYSEYGDALLEDIDRSVIVSEADIISMSNLGLIIKNLGIDGIQTGLEIIINKFNLRSVMSPVRITNSIKLPVKTFVPYDRDIQSLYLTRGPFPIFKYNLRIVRSISDFADDIYESLE
jgi:pilus assembly protein CpaE